MDQAYDATENYQPDGTLELAEEYNETEFSSQDITSFNLAALLQEAEQVAKTYTTQELDRALLVA